MRQKSWENVGLRLLWREMLRLGGLQGETCALTEQINGSHNSSLSQLISKDFKKKRGNKKA